MKQIRDFSRNALIYLSSNVLRAALPFLLLPFLIRELGAQEYGKIGLIASVFTLLVTLVGMGTHAYVRTSYTQSTAQELKRILGGAIIVVVGASLLILLLIALLSYWVELPLAFPYIIVGIFAAFGQKIISIKMVLWQMSDRPLIYGILSVLMTALNLSFSIFLVFSLDMNAEGRVLGMWLPAVMMGPLILLLMLVRNDVDLSCGMGPIRSIVQFGLPLIPHSFALALILFAERAALSTSSDATSLGVYFAAFQLSLPVSILSNSINLQFRSWSDRKMAAGEHQLVVRGSYLVMAILTLAGVAYAWLLQFFFNDLVGEGMSHGYQVCLLLIASAVLRGFYLVVVKGLFFSGRTGVLMTITVALSLFFSALLYLFNDLYTVACINLAFNSLLFLFVWVATAVVYPQPWLLSIGGANSHSRRN